MIKLPSVPPTDAGKSSVKSLNAPITSKVQLLQGVIMNDVTDEHLCFECRKPMTEEDHYKYVKLGRPVFYGSCKGIFVLKCGLKLVLLRADGPKPFLKNISLNL